MKKTELLNSEISYVIAGLGHGDMIVIGDCGLPVPKHVKKIDIALRKNVPGFMETLQTVLTEMQVEKAWMADEIAGGLDAVFPELRKMLEGIPLESLPHEDFKAMIGEQAVAVIRTGECTPYANILLSAGVTF